MIPLQCWPRCKHSGQASHGCQHLLGPPLGPSLGRVSVSRTPLRRPQLPLSGPSRDTRAVIAATREVFLLSRELSVMRLLWECLLWDFLAAIITTLSDSVPSRTMAAAAPSTSPVTPVPPCTATLAPHKIFFWPEIFFCSASILRIETDWFTTSWTLNSFAQLQMVKMSKSARSISLPERAGTNVDRAREGRYRC